MSEEAKDAIAEDVAESHDKVEESHDKPAEPDYKALAEKWEKFAKKNLEDAKAWREYEESQKTVEEKRAEELEQLKSELAQERSAKLRFEIAADRGITGDAIKLLDGNTREEIEEKADALQALIAQEPKTKSLRPDEQQGKAANLANTTADQFARAIDDIL